MDNLTHSLAGAVLGQMGLKKKTGLGMATLIIAANIPDIDAFAVLLGGHVHLGIRRGIDAWSDCDAGLAADPDRHHDLV